MNDATDRGFAPPQLPSDLDDLSALDDWFGAWNDWAADEAVKKKLRWLKPMTPATLHDIVENERRRRLGSTSGQNHDVFATKGNDPAWQRELIVARAALNQIENRLIKADAGYQAKRSLLVPILQPFFKDLPPARWAETFQQAYDAIHLPADQKLPATTKPDSKIDDGIPKSEIPHTSKGPLSADVATKNPPATLPLQPRSRALNIWDASVGFAVFYSAFSVMAWILTIVFRNLELGTAYWYVAVGIIVFQVINGLADELSWRLSGKFKEVNGAVYLFQHYKFPTTRRYRSDDISTYLHRICDRDLDVQVSHSASVAAAKLAENLHMHEQFGMFAGIRRRAALNEALELHAPRATGAR